MFLFHFFCEFKQSFEKKNNLNEIIFDITWTQKANMQSWADEFNNFPFFVSDWKGEIYLISCGNYKQLIYLPTQCHAREQKLLATKENFSLIIFAFTRVHPNKKIILHFRISHTAHHLNWNVNRKRTRKKGAHAKIFT